MKRHLYPYLFLLLLALGISACSDEGKRFKVLDEEISYITNSSSPATPEEIRSSIQKLEQFLSDYPDSKHKEYLTLQRRALTAQLEAVSFKKLQEKYEATIQYRNSDAADEYQSAIDLLSSSEAIQLQETHPELKGWLQRLNDDKALILKMKDFFERDYSSIENFNSEVRDNAYLYSNQSSNIAQIWETMTAVYQSKLADRILQEKIRHFEQELSDDAQAICLNDFEGFKVQRVETVSMGAPHKMSQYEGYECEGVFRVYLIGALIGWDKGSVKIQVKGHIALRVDSDNKLTDVRYSRSDYSVLERSGI